MGRSPGRFRRTGYPCPSSPTMISPLFKEVQGMSLPLDGVRVLGVGESRAGPLAGGILADLGADVIKIEKPDGGDDARIWGPPFGPDGVTSLYFYSQNRNKRSVALDLKSAVSQSRWSLSMRSEEHTSELQS